MYVHWNWTAERTIYRGYNWVSGFSLWGRNVISICKNKIGLSSLHGFADELHPSLSPSLFLQDFFYCVWIHTLLQLRVYVVYERENGEIRDSLGYKCCTLESWWKISGFVSYFVVANCFLSRFLILIVHLCNGTGWPVPGKPSTSIYGRWGIKEHVGAVSH